MEVTGQDTVGSLPMSSVSKTDSQGGNDSAEISALFNEVSEDASVDATDHNVAALTVKEPDKSTVEATDHDIAGSLPMSSVSDNSVSPRGLVACNTDNQVGIDSGEISALSVEVSKDASMEATDQDDASMEATDQDVASFSVDITNQDVATLPVEVPNDASMEAIDQDIAGSLPMSLVFGDSVSVKELVVCNTDNQYGNDPAEISDSLMSLLSCNTNTLVNGDVIPEEIAIPKQESSISVETMTHKKSPSTEVPVSNIDEVKPSTMTVAPIFVQKTSDIPIQSIVADQLKGECHCPAQSEPKDGTDERIMEDDKNKNYMMKENTGIYELQNMSLWELRKKLKHLALDNKSNSKLNNVAKEADKKRTALQVLPENRMTVSETLMAE